MSAPSPSPEMPIEMERSAVHDILYATKTATYFSAARTEIAPLLPDRTARVLEIGCGTGATLAWLRTVRPVTFAAGVELMPEVAAQARPVLDELVVGNVETLELPFPPASFDLILILDVLEHLVDPWAVMRTLHRLLAPGGCLIASVPNVSHYSVALPLLLRGRWTYTPDGLLDRTHLRFFVEQTAVDLLGSTGLTIAQVSRTRPLPVSLYRWPNWLLGRWARGACRRLLGWLPGWHMIDFQFLIRAQRAHGA